jgi:predicted amidohydrolase YtcJ
MRELESKELSKDANQNPDHIKSLLFGEGFFFSRLPIFISYLLFNLMSLYTHFKKGLPASVVLGCLICLLTACQSKKEVDLLVFGARIYSADSLFTTHEAMAIQDGKIAALGSKQSLLATYTAKEIIDAKDQFIYPGFIDAHAHFYGYAQNLNTVNLFETKSWDEVLVRLDSFSSLHPDGWLLGRGWDQNDWPGKQYPTREALNKRFPDRPVLLMRVDGHAAIVNQKALDLAGIGAGTKLVGGQVVLSQGIPTGLLIDNAVDLVTKIIPNPTPAQEEKLLVQAQANCFATGLTSIHDCGLSFKTIEALHALQKKDALQMRIYAMLSDEPANYAWMEKTGGLQTDFLSVKGFKVYADGALGSRGACLLAPYHDDPGNRGFLLSDPAHFDSVAALLYQKGWQMCTHAIGDSGNRTILNLYAKYLQGKNDRRWRIEHAQVVSPLDLKAFGQYNIIPSVQPTHATSDMYWAEERLGPARIAHAYAYQDLLKENNWIPLGTDFPVEDISPFKTFYAAVVRKDAAGWPKQGFQPAQVLSRKEALWGMTLWAAKAAFEESKKGSLEVGKWADFILLSQDLMTAPENQLLNTNVKATYLNGKKVY